MEKARKFQKNIYFCFIDYANAFDCVETLPWGQEEVERGPGPWALPCILLFQKINLQIQAWENNFFFF